MSDTKTILAVEDNEADRKLLSHALKQNGFKGQFLAAGSADEAYRLMVKRIDESLPLPDLVLLDLGLPDETGMEILQNLYLATGKKHILAIATPTQVQYINLKHIG